ncbi:hypothetical protein QF000_000132 [Paraburkholderia atlantica]|uniref:Uncharacterized protein n=2 Tax=Paraburkholderia TaxID=1822464 RepID=A0A7W8LEA6_9BURK|nr:MULTISPECIES: hypothetical protein [Paraburkholderia]MBB5405381.1 hypothetical protein [Paraburkholderia youngii]MBB5421122.1 hypothetical protein [Paraburkholderia atlantica]MBB5429157.1 hypothetical protein [Paraburkholderia atlantica]MPW11129.1 hypothetical protein [Paraburkholderia atlantica]NUY35620.1 hypothetical protein [Paraburkholderia atlantica]
MKPIKLRVSRDEAGNLLDDLTAWASTSGIDLGLSTFSTPHTLSSTNSPVVYHVYVGESFFEQFPEWRMFIEQ